MSSTCAIVWRLGSPSFPTRPPAAATLPLRGRDRIAPPHSISRTPHALEHLLDVSDWRVRQNAVAEIENKRPAAERCKNCIDAAIDRRAAGAQRQRIEIALHRPFALDRIA